MMQRLRRASTASSRYETVTSSAIQRPAPHDSNRRMRSYVIRDMVRNPRRTLASVAGIALAVGLFSGVSFFVDSSSSQLTARAIAPVTLDMQAGLINPLGSGKAAPVIANTPALSVAQIQSAIRDLHGVRGAEPFA